MDLGSSTHGSGPDGRSTAELLDEVSTHVRAQRRTEVELFQTIIAWADANAVEDLDGAATIRDSYLDTGLPIAGPGAPLVSEFGLIELCATLGRSLDSGRAYVGKVVEAGWRLPQIRDAVYAGRVPVWKALRVADLTRTLTADAAEFVDRNLAFALPTCTWIQVERLVVEAIGRFDPAAAEQGRVDAADGRQVRTEEAIEGTGVGYLSATVDLEDLVDIENAVARRAKVLAQFGCTESRDVRRSIALGEMARHDLTLDLEVTDSDTGEVTRVVPGRTVELYLHLTDQALTALGTSAVRNSATENSADNVGRLGNTQTPITVEQIRQWCGKAGGSVIVRPVIDLADHIPVDSYEIPDRHRTRVQLRDHTCRAPYCNRRAERCDLDHAVPHAHGGATCPCNLVPLCRQHHRAKTFGYWSYTVIDPATYLWISPNRRHWLVNPTGTRELTLPRSLEHDPDPPEWADPGWTEPGGAEPGGAEPGAAWP